MRFSIWREWNIPDIRPSGYLRFTMRPLWWFQPYSFPQTAKVILKNYHNSFATRISKLLQNRMSLVLLPTSCVHTLNKVKNNNTKSYWKYYSIPEFINKKKVKTFVQLGNWTKFFCKHPLSHKHVSIYNLHWFILFASEWV